MTSIKHILRMSFATALFCSTGMAVAQNITDAAPKLNRGTIPDSRPNIIVILADDLGIGDIGAYNNNSRIPTPNLDQLAAEGIRFTDAHSPSAVCSPTRYGLLTGRYAWRTSLKSGVLWGYSPALITPDRETIASVVKRTGYTTAAIGKWHLGLGTDEAHYFVPEEDSNQSEENDSFRGLTPGPVDVGFDYFFGIPASLDMKPYLFVENSRPTTPLDGTVVEESENRRSGGGGFWRKGQVGKDFKHSEVLPLLAEKAVGFIKQSAATDEPFFLYFPLTAPHTPWLPSDSFRGVSDAGYYGDFVNQVDSVAGEILTTLESLGIADNTLLVFTSDNGAHWLDSDKEKYSHNANGKFRGQKADIFEGGHRVPLIVRWPENIQSDVKSDQLIALTDLMATISEVVGVQNDEGVGEDSFSFLPALLGARRDQYSRPPVVHHSLDGMFAIRKGDWKLIEGHGSGGFTAPKRLSTTDKESAYRLFNLRLDPDESDDVAADKPAVVNELSALLNEIRSSGRTPE